LKWAFKETGRLGKINMKVGCSSKFEVHAMGERREGGSEERCGFFEAPFILISSSYVLIMIYEITKGKTGKHLSPRFVLRISDVSSSIGI
jgi:hypothetical protein